MRLQKYMALAGVASRRKAEQMIGDGRVTVNGQLVTEMGIMVSELDEIKVDGQIISVVQDKLVLMLHKPSSVVTTAHDQFGRKSVLDLIPSSFGRLYPVGRLDYHSEGLLLLTNDGDLAYALTHPKHHIQKVYHVTVTGNPTDEALDQLRNGVLIEDRKTAPATVNIIGRFERTTDLEIAITEGRNRQIRKMCEAVGYPVLHLARIKVGNLTLGSLKRGDFRSLTKEEMADLRIQANSEVK